MGRRRRTARRGEWKVRLFYLVKERTSPMSQLFNYYAIDNTLFFAQACFCRLFVRSRCYPRNFSPVDRLTVPLSPRETWGPPV